MVLEEFGKNYLLLGLRIGKLIEGYIDAYFGPPELKYTVDKEKPQSPKELLHKCKTLQKELPNQGFIEERIRFLGKMLGAMETSLEILNGHEIPYLEKVNRLYNIKPELIDDSVFYNVAKELDSIYEGSGNLAERMDIIQKRRAIPEDKIEGTFRKACEIVRERTLRLFPGLLPNEEEFTIRIVKNEPWGAYNWYLGNFKSKIDVNTDVPNAWTRVLLAAAHEGYPGHHTEHVVKEKLLYIEEHRFEHSIILIQTPECVIAEGIGNTGLDVLFSQREKVKIGLEELCPYPEKEYSLNALVAENEATKDLRALTNNLAIHAHVDGWSDDQLMKYGLDFGFIMKERLRQNLMFIRNPLWSTYVFNYFIGEMLIKKKFGERPSPSDFKKLLTQPILPSDLI
ncbi:MAG: hypothetical protein ACFFAQ_10730 [Promethearchaeota archaeon]